MKLSLNTPSFLSEIYNPKEIATSKQVILPETIEPIEPDTSTTGKILSVVPSIKFGKDFHCSFANSQLP